MRILLTADPELPVPPRLYGGIERIVDLLVRQLGARGHEVGLVAHRGSTAPAARLYPWPGTRSQRVMDTLRNTGALARAVADFRPQLVHSFSRLFYLLPLLPLGVPKVMSYQRRPGRRQVAAGARLGGERLAFTGCSEHLCAIGREAGGRWHAIPNFVDTDAYPFRPSVPPDAPLVFLSRIEPLKGAHLAIDIARRAGRALILAGNHGETGEEGRYWREAILPHVDGRAVRYAGPVDDAAKQALLGGALAMIVPIQWDEPFGIVFAEALACGTPVIACPRGALPEIVRDGVEGRLVRDVEEGVAAVEEVRGLSRHACRERAERHFSAAVVAGRYEALYREMVSA